MWYIVFQSVDINGIMHDLGVSKCPCDIVQYIIGVFQLIIDDHARVLVAIVIEKGTFYKPVHVQKCLFPLQHVLLHGKTAIAGGKYDAGITIAGYILSVFSLYPKIGLYIIPYRHYLLVMPGNIYVLFGFLFHHGCIPVYDLETGCIVCPETTEMKYQSQKQRPDVIVHQVPLFFAIFHVPVSTVRIDYYNFYSPVYRFPKKRGIFYSLLPVFNNTTIKPCNNCPHPGKIRPAGYIIAKIVKFH